MDDLEIVNLSVNAVPPEPGTFLTPFPIRSPMITATAIRDFIAGKVVCDVGCHKGDMLMEFGRFAAQVIGIEIEQRKCEVIRQRKARTTMKRNIRIIRGNALNIEIPFAHIYYYYWGEGDAIPFMERMYNEYTEPFTILASGHESQGFLSEYCNRWEASKILAFPYDEGETCDAGLAPAAGTWNLVMFERSGQDVLCPDCRT